MTTDQRDGATIIVCKDPISTEKVEAALSRITSGKSDGKVGFTTDFLAVTA